MPPEEPAANPRRAREVEGRMDRAGVADRARGGAPPGAAVGHTHLGLTGARAGVARETRVLVEVTPRWRHRMAAAGRDWSTAGLRRAYLGRWVRVRGWLLFDAHHVYESENTAPGVAADWR